MIWSSSINFKCILKVQKLCGYTMHFFVFAILHRKHSFFLSKLWRTHQSDKNWTFRTVWTVSLLFFPQFDKNISVDHLNSLPLPLHVQKNICGIVNKYYLRRPSYFGVPIGSLAWPLDFAVFVVYMKKVIRLAFLI